MYFSVFHIKHDRTRIFNMHSDTVKPYT